MKRNRTVWAIALFITIIAAFIGHRLLSINKNTGKAETGPAVYSVVAKSPVSQGKTREQVCLEHQCNMPECGMMVKADLKPGEKVKCPICGEYIMQSNSKVVPVESPAKVMFYRNPMDPSITSPVPMKDQMGMDYVPVYETDKAEPSGVVISLDKQKLLGIKVGLVEERDMVKTIRVSGKIAYDPDLVVTQKEFIEALSVLDAAKDSPLKEVNERARSMAEAARTKLKLMGMSEDEISGLERTRQAQTSLYLPKKGEDVWAYLGVYEYQIGLIKTGIEVDIESVAYPGQIFQGIIVSINPVLDSATRTNQVRVRIKNPEDKLKPEMFVSAGIKLDLGKRLTVAAGAVMDTGERTVVFVLTPASMFEMREITVGERAGDLYEVLKGLSVGEEVVSSGNFFVDSETKLKSPASAE